MWCVLVTDTTEQLLPGPQGIVFVFKNCCYMKWYSLNICLKILVVKMFSVSNLKGASLKNIILYKINYNFATFSKNQQLFTLRNENI